MARRRDINDIDEDKEGQIVDYSGDSDNGDKPTEILPEEKFRHHPLLGRKTQEDGMYQVPLSREKYL